MFICEKNESSYKKHYFSNLVLTEKLFTGGTLNIIVSTKIIHWYTDIYR